MARHSRVRFRHMGRVQSATVARAIRVASFRAIITTIPFETLSFALTQMARRDCDVLQAVAVARRYCCFASDSWERLETGDV